MKNPCPLEYLTSFSQTSQAMMQQLATGLLTSGDNATDFTRYSELALVQQNYLQQMGALWVNSAFGSGPVQPAKGDRRFASEEWKKRPLRERSDRACIPRRRSEEHTSELQSRVDLVCRLLLEKKKREDHQR